MKIALLARNPNLYSHKRLMEAAEQRGHEITWLNTLRCTVHIASHKPEVYYDGEPAIGFDAVIPRIGASITNYGLAILRQFEMRGCWSLNESVAIGRSRDKLRSMQIFAKHGLGQAGFCARVSARAAVPNNTYCVAIAILAIIVAVRICD